MDMLMRVEGLLFGMVFLNILWSAPLVFGEDDKGKDTSSLEEVVVTATRTEKKVDDAPASVSVITKKDMEKYDIQTVDDAIKYEPGLYVRRTKGLSDSITSVQMRGLSGQNRTLVLIDGLPVNDGFSRRCSLERDIDRECRTHRGDTRACLRPLWRKRHGRCDQYHHDHT